MQERDLVTHPNWREILEELSADQLNTLYSVSRLYDEACGFLDQPVFPDPMVEAARLEIGRTGARALDLASPRWEWEEQVALLKLRTGMERAVCEAYVDKEIMEAADAGAISGFTPG